MLINVDVDYQLFDVEASINLPALNTHLFSFTCVNCRNKERRGTDGGNRSLIDGNYHQVFLEIN